MTQVNSLAAQRTQVLQTVAGGRIVFQAEGF